MASSYSTRLKIELINPGEQSGSWGTTTNNNLDKSIEQSIAGVYLAALSGTGTTTLTTGNGPQDPDDNQARQASIRFTNSSSTHTVQYPAVEKTYLWINSSTTCTFTMRLGASGNTTTLKPGRSQLVATDGTHWYTLLSQNFSTNTGTTEWVEKTSNYTAVAGDRIFADTEASAAFTITLPSSPIQGDEVTIVDSTGHFDTNNLTVEPGSGINIMEQTAGDEMVVDTDGAAFTLVYQDSTYGWRFKDSL